MAKTELHPITKELLAAIDGAFATYASTIMVNASASSVEDGTDTIKIENTDVRLIVVVDRQKKLIHILGFMKEVYVMKEVPGTPSLLRFKGEIVLDFNDPKTKVDGNMFVDVFSRMMLQYKAIESLVEEKIVY